jgi:hypothetical protein
VSLAKPWNLYFIVRTTRLVEIGMLQAGGRAGLETALHIKNLTLGGIASPVLS